MKKKPTLLPNLPYVNIATAIEILNCSKEQLFELAIYSEDENESALGRIKCFAFIDKEKKKSARASYHASNTNENLLNSSVESNESDDIDFDDPNFFDLINKEAEADVNAEILMFDEIMLENDSENQALELKTRVDDAITGQSMIILMPSDIIELSKKDQEVTITKGLIEYKNNVFIELNFSGSLEPLTIFQHQILICKSDLDAIIEQYEKDNNIEKIFTGKERNYLLGIIESLVHVLHDERVFNAEAHGLKIPEPYDNSTLAKLIKNKSELYSLYKVLERTVEQHLKKNQSVETSLKLLAQKKAQQKL